MAIYEHDVTALVKQKQKPANGERYFDDFTVATSCSIMRKDMQCTISCYCTKLNVKQFSAMNDRKKTFVSTCIIIHVIIFNRYGLDLVSSPHSPTPSPPTIIRSYHFVSIVSISIWYK